MSCRLPDGRVERLQLLDPSRWRLVAYGRFYREEKLVILKARSILHAVQFAESTYPLGRLLVLSDNLALVLPFCKGRSNNFTLFSVVHRFFASGFRAVLSHRSGGYCLELNNSYKRSRC